MTKRVENPNRTGRPSKFRAVFETHRDKIKILTENGLTDKQISEIFGITQQTYYNWKLKYPEFFEVLKGWKLTADASVERSLWERANGYSCPETKAQWVETTELVDGQLVKSGRWEYAEMIKHYPPDPTSMIFWLKNRQPAEWRDKQEIDVTDSRLVKAILDALPADVADGVKQAIVERTGQKKLAVVSGGK